MAHQILMMRQKLHHGLMDDLMARKILNVIEVFALSYLTLSFAELWLISRHSFGPYHFH